MPLTTELLGSYKFKPKVKRFAHDDGLVHRRVYRVVKCDKPVYLPRVTPGYNLIRSDLGSMLCVDNGTCRTAHKDQEAGVLRSLARYSPPKEQRVMMTAKEALVLERYLRTGNTDGSADRALLKKFSTRINTGTKNG